MKFSQITQMGGVLRFQVYKTDIVYISKLGIYLNDKLLQQPNQFNVAYFCNDFLMYGNLDKLSRYSLLYKTTESLDPKYSYYWDFHNQEHSKVLISQNRRANKTGDRIADYHLFNLRTKILEKCLFTENPQIKIIDSQGFIIKGNVLYSLSLLTGEYEWEVDLGDRTYLDDNRQEKTASITQILGVCENQLLVVMDSGELISLDTQTGRLFWNKADIYTHSLSSFPNRSQFWRNYWHLEAGYLYQLDGNVYYRISLSTQVLEILWQDTKQDAYLTFSHKTFTEEYVYFTGSYNRALSPYLLGVFNRKTLQVDWLYDFGEALANKSDDYAHSLNQPPQVADNKLHVLDSGGTLHIFEKEG